MNFVLTGVRCGGRRFEFWFYFFRVLVFGIKDFDGFLVFDFYIYNSYNSICFYGIVMGLNEFVLRSKYLVSVVYYYYKEIIVLL